MFHSSVCCCCCSMVKMNGFEFNERWTSEKKKKQQTVQSIFKSIAFMQKVNEKAPNIHWILSDAKEKKTVWNGETVAMNNEQKKKKTHIEYDSNHLKNIFNLAHEDSKSISTKRKKNYTKKMLFTKINTYVETKWKKRERKENRKDLINISTERMSEKWHTRFGNFICFRFSWNILSFILNFFFFFFLLHSFPTNVNQSKYFDSNRNSSASSSFINIFFFVHFLNEFELLKRYFNRIFVY